MTAMYHLPEGMQTRIIELQGPPSMDDAIKATAPSRAPMKIRAVSAPAGQLLWPPQQATRVRSLRSHPQSQTASSMKIQLSLRAAAPLSSTIGG